MLIYSIISLKNALTFLIKLTFQGDIPNEEKKVIFLSFRPEFFRPILYNIKKYEYRKRFCDEATMAYLYLSSPIREVVGILDLGKPIHMEKIIKNYNINGLLYSRIRNCLQKGEKYAIPIVSFTLFKHPVSFEKLKEVDSSFHVPQCYLNLTNYPTLFSYLKEQECYEPEFFNSHNQLYENNFAVECREIEKSKEFNIKDKAYLSQEKYKVIKCGYITKK